MQAQQVLASSRGGGDVQSVVGSTGGDGQQQLSAGDVGEGGVGRAGPNMSDGGGQYWHLQEQLLLRQQQERQNPGGFPSGMVMGVQTAGMGPNHGAYYFGQGFPIGGPQPYFDQRQVGAGMPMAQDTLGRGGMGMGGGLQHMGRHFPPQGMIHGGLPDFSGIIQKGDDASGGEHKGRKVPKRSLAATIERMEKHKLLERKRREKTKELMTELQALVPMQQDAGDNPTMNMVLEEAIEFLKTQQWEAAARAKHPCTCGAPGIGSNPMPHRPRDKPRERDDDEGGIAGSGNWTGSEAFAGGNSSGEGGEDEPPANRARKTEKTAKE